MSLETALPKANPSTVFHVAQRAAHTGFLCIAVYPQARPEGFAVYYLSTLSLDGSDNRRFGRVHAYADRIGGEMSFQAGIQNDCHVGDVFVKAISDHLALFGELVGPSSYESMLRCLGTGHGDSHEYSAIGILRRGASYFRQIGDTGSHGVKRNHILRPLGRFEERLRQEGPLFFQGPNAVLHNFLQCHMRQLTPR
jgi:hypothetical protein